MSDLKLFRVIGGSVEELPARTFALEKHLQELIERNMVALFGTRFLASEYSTGAVHGGRIDSLGLDENGSPVIFEYKRSSNESVINQGLFYLDWLMDHRAEFEKLVTDVLGAQRAPDVDWRNPRLVCVAGDFTRYDEHAVRQINRSIDLVRYRDFNGELLALELVTSRTAAVPAASQSPAVSGRTGTARKTVSDYLAQADGPLKDLYAALESLVEGLGDDVTKKTLKDYFAFRRLKNFICVEVHPAKSSLLIFLKIDPATVSLEEGFTRDVSQIGHFGTGDLEVRIRTRADLERAEPLIRRSYEVS
ncbi:DUF5655 domain-containing protein [Actinocorallia sp. B10E7]|uniref:DUF5655 domain-containing protein n=1 Tax=Actinocorallia sp. B10E7 TaxID=3153558 RepID=UPI00325DB2CA